MGKVRRYKKKLAKVALAEEKQHQQQQIQQPEKTDYMQLAEELLRLKKDDDKMSVCSVMKSIKSSGGEESLKLKKDAKRYLKHAFLMKKLEKTQKVIKKKKKKCNKNDETDEDDEDDNDEIGFSNQKVLNWPAGTGKETDSHFVPVKRHRKGQQKKMNTQLAKDLVTFSKKIKRTINVSNQSVTIDKL
ncbi:uncharacterized protein LOC126834565 [Adelges cooleyi]|uniref:uncharacterized protein LOC126834565 n=1 Tax=Adelges cooleyi TaxID=133065 RepID=UPI00217F6A14|nr:uncharacterized protein LOC126834565 [Adelges cooleyi]